MECMGIAIDRGITNERWWCEWFPLMTAVRDDSRFEAQLERARAIREAVQAECAAI
jgi:hypothetical protein